MGVAKVYKLALWRIVWHDKWDELGIGYYIIYAVALTACCIPVFKLLSFIEKNNDGIHSHKEFTDALKEAHTIGQMVGRFHRFAMFNLLKLHKMTALMLCGWAWERLLNYELDIVRTKQDHTAWYFGFTVLIYIIGCQIILIASNEWNEEDDQTAGADGG